MNNYAKNCNFNRICKKNMSQIIIKYIVSRTKYIINRFKFKKKNKLSNKQPNDFGKFQNQPIYFYIDFTNNNFFVFTNDKSLNFA